jgi:hypothetical protein
MIKSMIFLILAFLSVQVSADMSRISAAGNPPAEDMSQTTKGN